MSKILEQRLKQVEFARNVWAVTPEAATTFEDLLRPSYWSHVARTLQKNDRIEVLAADGSYFAELIVLSKTDIDVRVGVLRKVQLAEIEQLAPPSADEFEVKHRGGAGWSVIRKADKKVMFERGETQAQAAEWVSKNANAALA